MQLNGAIALVTGASSGIGAATAEYLGRAGARLLLTGRDEQRLQTVATLTGGVALPADLTEPDGPDRLVDRALAAAGRIDLLVCNAGVGWAGPISQLSAATAAEIVNLNLLAPVQLTRLVAPGMVARRSGRLVFVSSIAGAIGVRHEAVYAATKAGLNCLAESLEYELAGHAVGVSLVLPGVVDTPFFSRRGSAYHRHWPGPIPADRVAAAVARAAANDLPLVYVPGWLRIPAWLHGAAPRTFAAMAGRFG